MTESWAGITICQLDPYEFTVDGPMNEQYLDSMEAYHPRYAAGRSGQAAIVHPGLLLNRSNDTRSPSYRIPSREAGIHAKDEAYFLGLVYVGEPMRTTWEYTDRYERRGRPYLVIECSIRHLDGRPILRRRLVRTITTDSAPIVAKREPTALEGTVAAREAGPPSSASADPDIGRRLYGRLKTMTLDRMRMFSGPNRNIHTDEVAATAAGLPKPIVSATQSMGHICELMVDYFGDQWLASGTLKATFVRPIVMDDVVGYEGRITAKTPSESGTGYEVSVTGANQLGQPVTVATASAVH